MKRKIDLVDEEHEGEDKENESSSDESEDEEPRIKDVLSHLSQTKPRALNTLLDGLAELGIDKGLIRNKKLVFDLIEKEKDFQNSENTFENESNVESSSDREEDGEELASVNGSGDEDTQENDNDSENDSEETESSSPEPSTVIHSENLCEHCENSNVYGTLIMKCPKCVGTITTKIVLYAITRSPRREITSKRAFFGVTIVEQLHTKTPNVGNQFLFPF